MSLVCQVVDFVRACLYMAGASKWKIVNNGPPRYLSQDSCPLSFLLGQVPPGMSSSNPLPTLAQIEKTVMSLKGKYEDENGKLIAQILKLHFGGLLPKGMMHPFNTSHSDGSGLKLDAINGNSGSLPTLLLVQLAEAAEASRSPHIIRYLLERFQPLAANAETRDMRFIWDCFVDEVNVLMLLSSTICSEYFVRDYSKSVREKSGFPALECLANRDVLQLRDHFVRLLDLSETEWLYSMDSCDVLDTLIQHFAIPVGDYDDYAEKQWGEHGSSPQPISRESAKSFQKGLRLLSSLLRGSFNDEFELAKNRILGRRGKNIRYIGDLNSTEQPHSISDILQRVQQRSELSGTCCLQFASLFVSSRLNPDSDWAAHVYALEDVTYDASSAWINSHLLSSLPNRFAPDPEERHLVLKCAKLFLEMMVAVLHEIHHGVPGDAEMMELKEDIPDAMSLVRINFHKARDTEAMVIQMLQQSEFEDENTVSISTYIAHARLMGRTVYGELSIPQLEIFVALILRDVKGAFEYWRSQMLCRRRHIFVFYLSVVSEYDMADKIAQLQSRLKQLVLIDHVFIVVSPGDDVSVHRVCFLF